MEVLGPWPLETDSLQLEHFGDTDDCTLAMSRAEFVRG